MENNYDNHPIDLSYLIEMLGNNRAFIVEFIDAFFEQTPLYLEEIENALFEHNWDRVARSAHKIKPTFAYFGRHDIKELVQTIELDARETYPLDKVKTDVELLKLALNKLYLQLVEVKVKL